MAIVRVPRLDGESSPEVISADESDSNPNSSESDNESDLSDLDSGMESDEFELDELGESNFELCQLKNQTLSIPTEIYDLDDLRSVLSLETWNECLTEEERFYLSEFLPDLDRETLGLTLIELFGGKSFHFSCPVNDLFDKLRGGMLDPRIVIYHKALSFLKRRQYYHLLREYQNSMCGGFVRIRDAWEKCEGYGVEERLRILYILRSRRSFVRNGNVGSDTGSESLEEGFQASERSPKLSGKKKYMGVCDFEKKSRASNGLLCFPQQNRAERYYLESGRMAKNPMRGGDNNDDDVEEEEDDDHDDDILEERCEAVNKKGYVGLPQFNSARSRIAYEGVTKAAYNPHSLETMSNAKYPAKDWKYSVKDSGRQGKAELSVKGKKLKAVGDHKSGKSKIGLESAVMSCRNSSAQLPQGKFKGKPAYNVGMGMGYSRYGTMLAESDETESDSSERIQEGDGKYSVKDSGRQGKAELSVKGKKVKAVGDHKSGKSKIGLDSTVMSCRNSSAQTPQGKFKGKPAYNVGMGMGYSRYGTLLAESNETESDSSERIQEGDGEISPYMYTKDRQLGGAIQPVCDSKKNSKLTNVDIKVESCSTKGKYESKIADSKYIEDIILVKKTEVPHSAGKSQKPWKKSYTVDKKRKGEVDMNHSSDPNYMIDFGSGRLKETAGYLDGSSQFVDVLVQENKSNNSYQIANAITTDSDQYRRSNTSLLGCSSATKKRKENSNAVTQDGMEESAYTQVISMQQNDERNIIKKKGKRKADAATVPPAVTPDAVIPEKEMAYTEPEPKPRKKPFILITPSTHTGFSFSIIHLLSVIRKAMITPHIEETPAMGDNLDKSHFKLKSESEENKEIQAINGTHVPDSNLNMDVNVSEAAGRNNLPSLTIQEIVNRVRTNPGDPCILKTQEPLQDLVRGVLKIFSSKTAPLGAKNWKALVSYERSNKSWFWVGPISSSPPDNVTIEEETSSEAWGLPHKTLVKLVDSFANWLKNGQETLKQIGSLPPPPTSTLQQLDEKERFRDLRAQKSLNTINPSSEEVRNYFRKEEILRYAIPDRAFSYTATDGKKSIVAPLRRGGGKSMSKARDHFMLKPDRPPHVTILCLVRDAAARLPGRIGTRADVCTLIRDSQYVVEDVTDEKVNQIVSGALDRLHYERDPCVQFDGERKLWVYLHRDREEEDFEDDGTSSTKKWKRPRKDGSDQPDIGVGNEASYPINGDQAGGGSDGYDLNSDLIVNTLPIPERTEHIPSFSDLRSNMENMQMQLYIDQSFGDRAHSNAMSWETLPSDPLCENKMLCQENSAKEDFNGEAFGRERPVGLLNASLL